MVFSVFSIQLQGTSIRVQGCGIIHAIHVVIESDNLVVDDLGRVVGDIHDLLFNYRVHLSEYKEVVSSTLYMWS